VHLFNVVSIDARTSYHSDSDSTQVFYYTMFSFTQFIYVSIDVLVGVRERLSLQTWHHNTIYKHTNKHSWCITGWRRLIGCRNLQVIFRQRATNHRALLQKRTYTDKVSVGCSPLCPECSNASPVFIFLFLVFLFWLTRRFSRQRDISTGDALLNVMSRWREKRRVCKKSNPATPPL